MELLLLFCLSVTHSNVLYKFETNFRGKPLEMRKVTLFDFEQDMDIFIWIVNMYLAVNNQGR